MLDKTNDNSLVPWTRLAELQLNDTPAFRNDLVGMLSNNSE